MKQPTHRQHRDPCDVLRTFTQAPVSNELPRPKRRRDLIDMIDWTPIGQSPDLPKGVREEVLITADNFTAELEYRRYRDGQLESSQFMILRGKLVIDRNQVEYQFHAPEPSTSA